MAKHKVSLSFAMQFIDFAAKHGFNFINVCIYGRIRTSVFNLFPETESYSQDEIRRIVEYASSKEIEIIPNYELFGHADHFLQFPELEHLAELRGGRSGRFSSVKHVFCPSEERVYEFIEAYLRETVPLFPGKFIHAGLDETFDIGLCDRCSERMKTEGQSGIFQKHILRIHDIIHNKFGKRMMMWDDFLELYPEAFQTFPRDIVMLTWWYDDILPPYGHIGGPRQDNLAFHATHGFDYLGVPATYSFRNIESFTAHVENYHPLGMLLSNWGAMTRFNSYPAITYAGKMWSNSLTSSTAKAETVHEMCGTADPCLTELFNFYFCMGEHEKLPVLPSAYGNALLSPFEYRKRQISCAVLEAVLKRLSGDGLSSDQFRVLSEMRQDLESEKIYYSLREILSRWSNPKTNFNDWHSLKTILEHLQILNADAKSFFMREYQCRIPDCFAFDDVILMLEKILSGKTMRPTARLKVCYPCRLGLGALDYSVRYEGATQWQHLCKLGGQSLYPYYMDETESAEYFLLDETALPSQLKIEYAECTSGVVRYTVYETADADYVPERILTVEGKVSSLENLLNDGRDFSIFGEGESFTIEKIVSGLKPPVNSVEIKLRRADRNRHE